MSDLPTVEQTFLSVQIYSAADYA